MNVKELQSREKSGWLKVVKVKIGKGKSGGWAIAIVVDGYYAMDAQADEMLQYWAEVLEIPASRLGAPL